MSDNTYDPHTGAMTPGPDDCPDFSVERRRFVRVRAGRVLLSQGRGKEPVELQHLRGRLIGVAQRWDAGRPESNIKAHWRLAAKLVNPELGEVFFETDTNSTTPYIGMAGALLRVPRGAFVAFSASIADENDDKSPTFLNLHVWDPVSQTWSQVMRDGWPAAITDKALHYVTKAENARALVPSLPSFVDAVALGYELPPKGCSPSSPHPAAVQTSAPDPKAPSETPSGTSSETTSSAPSSPSSTTSTEGSSSPATGGATPAPNAVPEGRAAFGFAPPRWFAPGEKDVAPTDGQNAAIRKKVGERGVYAPGAEGLVTWDQAFAARDAITKAYGLAVTRYGSKATALVVYDFLVNASVEQIQALQAALQAAAVPVEEDPFADE